MSPLYYLLITTVSIIVTSFLTGLFSKKGENKALIEDIRKITYEQYKGENLATKEDIKEITQKIESVKTELNHLSQSKLILADKQYDILIDAYQGVIKAKEECFYTPYIKVNRSFIKKNKINLSTALDTISNLNDKLYLVALVNGADNLIKQFNELISLFDRSQRSINDFIKKQESLMQEYYQIEPREMDESVRNYTFLEEYDRYNNELKNYYFELHYKLLEDIKKEFSNELKILQKLIKDKRKEIYSFSES